MARRTKLSEQPSPSHSIEYIENRELELDITDQLSAFEKALVHEYGYFRAMKAIRQYHGLKALDALEAEREALQVTRWKNITL